MRYAIGVISVIVIALFAIILIVTRTPNTNTPQIDGQLVNLPDYSDSGALVTFTTEGRLQAQENHRIIRISISSTERTIDVLSGYDGEIIDGKTFTNSEAAFDEFMYGLKNAGFSSEKEAEYETEKGVCPLGKRYIYELHNGGEQLVRLWASSCRRADGTFAGNTNLVRRLFQEQIPGYAKLASGTNL